MTKWINVEKSSHRPSLGDSFMIRWKRIAAPLDSGRATMVYNYDGTPVEWAAVLEWRLIDAESARQMRLAEKIMLEDKDILAALA